jgi:hypothetical protein
MSAPLTVFVFPSTARAPQWTKEKVEIKTIQLTIVGAEQAKPERVLSAVL